MNNTAQINIQSLIDGFPHASAVINRKGEILLMNRLMEATTGYSCSDVAGLHGELIIRSNVGNLQGELYQKVVQGGKTVSVAGDIINCNRRKVPVQYTVSPLYQKESEEVSVLLVVVEDMSSSVIEKKQERHGEPMDTEELIGYSPKIQKVLDLLPVLARTDSSVLITGETGTGKDQIAEIIHKNSQRSEQSFVKINCGALPAGLLESELFGHTKGAFTGATHNRAGMFELADKGTVFLTEIGDMPLPLQVKLLSFLDDMEFVPVGAEEKVRVDVRIIAATHRSLREQVAKDNFREDLFYRLHVLHIELPPLRERDDDIRLLLNHFLQNYSGKLKKKFVGFSPEALHVLLAHSYPGNIRELKNIVEYSANICTGKKISKDNLPGYLFEQQAAVDGSEYLFERDDKKAGQVEGFAPDATWEDIEREMIIQALTKFSGNRTRAAEELHWGRMKLYRKLRHYNLM